MEGAGFVEVNRCTMLEIRQVQRMAYKDYDLILEPGVSQYKFSPTPIIAHNSKCFYYPSKTPSFVVLLRKQNFMYRLHEAEPEHLCHYDLRKCSERMEGPARPYSQSCQTVVGTVQ